MLDVVARADSLALLDIYYQLRDAGWDGLDALRLARWYAD
jgi:hypothetical protein